MKKILSILGIFLCGAGMILLFVYLYENDTGFYDEPISAEQTEINPENTDIPPHEKEEEKQVALSETTRVAPKVIRNFSTSNEDADKFPKPLQIKLEPITGPDSKPVDKNLANIFFTDNGNSGTAVVRERKYTLAGKVGPSIQEIEIIHGGDYQSGFLSNFQNLNFNTVLSHMKEGKNVYLIRAYSRNNTVFERIFTLYYYPYKKTAEDFQLRRNLRNISFEEESGYEQCGPFYDKTLSDGGYTEWWLMPNQYGENTQRLALGNGVNFVYSQKKNPNSKHEYDRLVGEISFEDNEKIYGPLKQNLWCGQFALHNIRKINETEYMFTVSGGHEGEPREYYFNRSKKVFLNTYDMVRKVDGNKTYGIFSVDVNSENIIITENRYCCDDVFSLYGLERLYFSKTGDFIKRELLDNTSYAFGKSVKTETSVYASSRAYGYEMMAETGNHPVTNPEMIDNFFEKHEECFTENNGMVCMLNYEFELDSKSHAKIKNISIYKIIQS